MKKLVVATTSVLLLLAAPAVAADIVRATRIAGPDISAPTWTGFYVGANAGYGWGTVATSQNFLTTSGPLVGIGAGTFDPPLTFAGADRKYSNNGALGGVQAGYNMQLSNLVLGIETDWQAADLQGVDAFDATVAGPFYTGTAKLDWFGTVRGRIGYAFDRWMPYVTGGLAYGHTTSTLTIQPGTQSAPTDPPFRTTISDIAVGYAVGGGLEVMLNSSWSIKAEYLHIDLGTNNLLFSYGAAGSAGTSASDPIDLARGGVNFRF